jgi:hypothetical protein
MRKLLTLNARALPGRGALGALLLAALAACALLAVDAGAQSGRRKTPPPQTQPTPEAEPQGESESESRPRPSGANSNVLASFVVLAQEDTGFGSDSMARTDVLQSFVARLGRSQSVSVTSAGSGSRGDAHRRAKTETSAFVVLVAVEDEFDRGPRPAGQDNQRSLVIRTHVYEPKTGALKFTDVVYQRAARSTVGVGGVRLPVPTRGIGRYPSQLELRQAAQDAADRVLSRFQIVPPPDHP